MASAFVQIKQSFAFFQPDHSLEYWAIRNDGIDKKTDVIWTYQYSFPDVFEMVQLSNFSKRYSRLIISRCYWSCFGKGPHAKISIIKQLDHYISCCGSRFPNISKLYTSLCVIKSENTTRYFLIFAYAHSFWQTNPQKPSGRTTT